MRGRRLQVLSRVFGYSARWGRSVETAVVITCITQTPPLCALFTLRTPIHPTQPSTCSPPPGSVFPHCCCGWHTCSVLWDACPHMAGQYSFLLLLFLPGGWLSGGRGPEQGYQVQVQGLARRGRLQLNQAAYLARLRAQAEWERAGAGLDGEGVEAGAGAPGVGVGRGRRAALASSATKTPRARSGPAGQPSHPSLQGSIYQVSIFLPVYW